MGRASAKQLTYVLCNLLLQQLWATKSQKTVTTDSDQLLRTIGAKDRHNPAHHVRAQLHHLPVHTAPPPPCSHSSTTSLFTQLHRLPVHTAPPPPSSHSSTTSQFTQLHHLPVHTAPARAPTKLTLLHQCTYFMLTRRNLT